MVVVVVVVGDMKCYYGRFHPRNRSGASAVQELQCAYHPDCSHSGWQGEMTSKKRSQEEVRSGVLLLLSTGDYMAVNPFFQK